jgi:MinD superfamily P-loop ATPase
MRNTSVFGGPVVLSKRQDVIVSIASGKGGTGKTTVAVNLALALKEVQPVQFLDCDVEEPNAHFFLRSQIDRSQTVYLPTPEIREEKCTFCGKCAEICAYNALAVLKSIVLVFPELCHGCGGCTLLCPEKAIQEKGHRIGILEFGTSDSISFAHGKLDIGQAMSPPLIRALKKHIKDDLTAIIDAPAGTSCPVVESVKRSDISLLVTEPTPFGLNDLQLAVETLKELQIPLAVIVNRSDGKDRSIREYCQKKNIPILMTIPLDRTIAEAYSEGKTIIETQASYRDKFLGLFAQAQELIK